jgi:hypothetical protein
VRIVTARSEQRATGEDQAQPRAVRRLAVAAPLAALALLVWASGAQAIIIKAHGQRFGVEPVPSTPLGANPMARALSRPLGRIPRNGVRYFGGPVMSSNTNYAVYWDPAGAPAYGTGYQKGINTFFADLAEDSGGLANTDSVLEQYGGVGGEFTYYNSHFGGALVDKDSYPPNGCSAAPICLTDPQLQAELRSFVESNHLPMDLQHEYFILTPPKVESCFEAEGLLCSGGTENAAYCAYHGFIEAGAQVIVYANDPYAFETVCDPKQAPNNVFSDATLGGGLVHEHSESLTDPMLNAWLSKSGEEVGDLCRTFEPKTEFGTQLGTAEDGAKYNQVVNGDLYWYQQEWSNEAAGCVQRASQVPKVLKVLPRSGPKAGGTVVTISGQAFLGPEVVVYFNGVPATKVTVNSPESLTATAPPSSVVGAIHVTVKTVETTSPTSKDRFRYKK